MASTTTLVAVLCVSLIRQAMSHGWMDKPTMRGSMWRYPTEYPEMASPINSNDNALRAGGPFYVGINNDLMVREYGFCGDTFTDPTPRQHESGGTFGRYPTLGDAAISACYPPGANIDIGIEITANHGGVFSYELCVPGAGNNEDESCFENGYVLQKSDGSGFEYVLPSTGGGRFEMTYKLPQNVTCDNGSRCVLRWYWLTSNAPRFGSNLLEEYWNCADIQISNNCGGASSPLPSTSSKASASPVSPSLSTNPSPSNSPKSTVTTTPKASTSPKASASPTPSITPSKSPVSNNQCNCNEGYCPTGKCTNCLLVYGHNNGSRLCYVGYTKSQCVSSFQTLIWCGA